MWKLRQSHPDKRLCDHSDTKTSPTAGLERVLCLTCGHVSVRYVEEVVVDDIVLDVFDTSGELV